MSALARHTRAASLVWVAAMLPFESTSGALHISGWTVTALEGALLLCAGVEVLLRLAEAAQALRGRGLPPGSGATADTIGGASRHGQGVFVGGAMLFAGCGLLSGVLAPELSRQALGDGASAAAVARVVALKGAARLLVDALIGLSACAVVARPPRWLSARALLGVVVGSASLSALLGVAEQQWLDGAAVEPILRHFRDKATLAGGVRRLTATFAQANVSAGFFALALPLSVALAWSAPAATAAAAARDASDSAMVARKRARRPWLWLLTSAILLWALLGTYSRGAIFATALAFAGAAAGITLGARHAGQPRALRRLGWHIALALAIVGLRVAVDPALRNRLGLPPQGPQISWTVTIDEAPTSSIASRGSGVAKPGRPDATRARLHIRNTGWLPWRTGGSDPMRIRAVARDAAGRVLGERRTRLPHTVDAGATCVVDAARPNTGAAGGVTVRWLLEQHGRRSFDASPPALQRAGPTGQPGWTQVRRPAAQSGGAQAVAHAADAGQPRAAGRADLWPVALARWRARPLVGWGADTFRLRWPQDLPQLRADRRMHANSLWLELAADLGLLGLATFTGVLLWTLRRGRAGGPVAVGASIGVAAWALHGGVDCLLYFHAPAALWWLSAGVAHGLARYSADNAKRRNVSVCSGVRTELILNSAHQPLGTVTVGARNPPNT